MNTLLSNFARHCRRDHYSLQKCRKIRNFNVDYLKIFWGHSPQTLILGRDYGTPHTGEGLRHPSPDPIPLGGASRLPGPSVPPPWPPLFTFLNTRLLPYLQAYTGAKV